jgi:hypothetical protein
MVGIALKGVEEEEEGTRRRDAVEFYFGNRMAVYRV